MTQENKGMLSFFAMVITIIVTGCYCMYNLVIYIKSNPVKPYNYQETRDKYGCVRTGKFIDMDFEDAVAIYKCNTTKVYYTEVELRNITVQESRK